MGFKISGYANKVKLRCGEHQGIMIKPTIIQLRYIWIQILPQPVTTMTIIAVVPSICAWQHYVPNFPSCFIYIKSFTIQKSNMTKVLWVFSLFRHIIYIHIFHDILRPGSFCLAVAGTWQKKCRIAFHVASPWHSVSYPGIWNSEAFLKKEFLPVGSFHWCDHPHGFPTAQVS